MSRPGEDASRDARIALERALAVRLDPDRLLGVDRLGSGGDAESGSGPEVIVAALRFDAESAHAWQIEAGMADAGTDAVARMLSVTGWSVDTDPPPGWWSHDASGLDQQAGRILEPNGWAVSGLRDGVLYVLATWTG